MVDQGGERWREIFLHMVLFHWLPQYISVLLLFMWLFMVTLCASKVQCLMQGTKWCCNKTRKICCYGITAWKLNFIRHFLVNCVWQLYDFDHIIVVKEMCLA